MHAGAVGEAAEGDGNRHIGSRQNVHTSLVQSDNVVKVALREGVEAAAQGVEPGLYGRPPSPIERRPKIIVVLIVYLKKEGGDL
jgi:hypothetical protein